jgi:hypothetical protein
VPVFPVAAGGASFGAWYTPTSAVPGNYSDSNDFLQTQIATVTHASGVSFTVVSGASRVVLSAGLWLLRARLIVTSSAPSTQARVSLDILPTGSFVGILSAEDSRYFPAGGSRLALQVVDLPLLGSAQGFWPRWTIRDGSGSDSFNFLNIEFHGVKVGNP